MAMVPAGDDPEEQAVAGQMEAAAAATRMHSDGSLTSVTLGAVTINVKEREREDAGAALASFLLDSPAMAGVDTAKLRCAMEAIDAYDGSGCAVMHTLNELEGMPVAEGEAALALLAAGQGSRLWGISAAAGFVKALACVYQKTLLELTIGEARMLLSETPSGGGGVTLVAGTDNVFIPSSFPLRTVNGQLYKNLPRQPALTMFSKEVPVLDDNGSVIDKEVMKHLEQLGILMVGADGQPEVFLEKVAEEEIVRVLKERGSRSVFFNAFLFAFSNEAAAFMRQRYSRTTMADPAVSFCETPGFDFSGHVLEPLICQSDAAWQARQACQDAFSDPRDWAELRTIACEFKDALGSICVVNLGAETMWYDAGMSRDLLELYRISSPSEDNGRARCLRTLLGVTEADVSVGGDAVVVNSTLPPGSSVGKDAVVINSTFSQPTVVPPGCVVVNSSLRTVTLTEENSAQPMDCLIYSVQKPSEDLLVKSNTVFFGAHLAGGVATGFFPLHVNPKKTEAEIYGDHYNTGANEGVRYLEQSIAGMPEDLSFTRLFREQRVNLSASLAFLTARRHVAST